jgi:biotin synthase-related radical SAM superfamily protein
VVSRGLRIDREVYQRCGKDCRIYPNALTCNCFKLPDGTIVMATDLGFHLSILSSMFSWDNLKLFKYMGDMTTDYRLGLADGTPTLLWRGEAVTPVELLPGTEFFRQKTSSGMPFMGNAVLQGCDWVAFQCLWPCEYAIAGKPCQFCFSGGQFEALARRKKPMPPIPSPRDVSEVVLYAAAHDGVNSMQLTGGSTFRGEKEREYITAYLEDLEKSGARAALTGELLLYITPPEDQDAIDRYFALGASRIACSLEVWDDELGKSITPGKRSFTTKERHLEALTYIAEKYGPGRAFCNFIIGLEPFETLREGAEYLARRGIIPSASVWMPFGKPVNGSMKPAGLDYFRRTKEMLGELYLRYGLEPAGCCGLNVCVERDIWRAVTGKDCC